MSINIQLYREFQVNEALYFMYRNIGFPLICQCNDVKCNLFCNAHIDTHTKLFLPEVA